MKTLAIISSSWEFFRKQPALASVALWLLFLPMFAMDTLDYVMENDFFPEDIGTETSIASIVLILLFTLINFWGHCCVLVVGRRMLQTKAGRSRTSFSATASQARGFIIPFLLTNILRACITMLWMLPLFAILLFAFLNIESEQELAQLMPFLPFALIFTIPGIIYTIRTSFSPVIIVGENISYRPALRRSKDAVRGNFWSITGQFLIIGLLLFVLPMVLISFAAVPLPEHAASPFAISVVTNAWLAIAVTLVNLCLIQIYERYRVPVKR